MFSDAKALESFHGRLPPSACIYKFASEAAGICWNLLALYHFAWLRIDATVCGHGSTWRFAWFHTKLDQICNM